MGSDLPKLLWPHRVQAAILLALMIARSRARDRPSFRFWISSPNGDPQSRVSTPIHHVFAMFSPEMPLLPESSRWPRFARNTSEQFEARLVMVEVLPSPSVLFAGMAGSKLPIVVAHGEGRAAFADPRSAEAALEHRLVTIRYVDHHGRPTDTYPRNPNGSPLGITGLTNGDGRVTILMPHPERCFLRRQYSWLPRDWPHEDGPWFRLFQNARRWVG